MAISVDGDDEQYSSEEESTGHDNEEDDDDEEEELEDEKYHGVVVEDVSESDEEEEGEDNDDEDDDEEAESVNEEFQDEPMGQENDDEEESEDEGDDVEEDSEEEEDHGVIVEDLSESERDEEQATDESDEEEGVSEKFEDEQMAHDNEIRVESQDFEDDEEEEQAESENEEEEEEESEHTSDEDDDEDSEEEDDEEKALFDDEHDDIKDYDEEAAKRLRTLMILACCCCCLVIIAIVLVILFLPRGDKDSKPTLAPTASPSLIPTIAPTSSPTRRPTLAPTASPTATPGLAVVSDTYLRSGNFADTDFGTSESIQILDGDGDGFQAIILLLFNISAMVGEVDNIFDQTNFYLRLFHVESVNDEISDISVLRLPYTDSLQVESLTWNTFTAPTEGVITGTTFVIEEDSQMLNVDITNLLSTTGRRLRGYTAEEVGDVNMLFLQLQATNNTDLFGELFRSREYLNGTEAPQIVTWIRAVTAAPSVSRAPTNMPSMSKQPTITPTHSLSPTITPQPSLSTIPSVTPSVSIQPSESPTDRITCDDEPAPCGANAYCVETTGTDVVYCECGDLTRVAFGEACTDEHSGTTLCVAGTCTGEGAQCEEIFSSSDVAIGIECVCEDETVVGNDETCNVTNSTRW